MALEVDSRSYSFETRRIAATRPENVASAVRGGIGGPLTMLTGGVLCSNGSGSPIGVAVRRSGLSGFISDDRVE